MNERTKNIPLWNEVEPYPGTLQVRAKFAKRNKVLACGYFFARFVFTWLYNKTKGGILSAILFHVSANTSFEFLPTSHVHMALEALIAVVIMVGTRMWEKLAPENPAAYRTAMEAA